MQLVRGIRSVELSSKRLCIVLAICVVAVITASAQTFTTLVNFNTTDGNEPGYVALIQGTDGAFYGTTISGGRFLSGTVFRVTADGELTTLYSFCAETNCADGMSPFAGVTLAGDGNFYGTTDKGGISEYCCGTVFKLSPHGEITTLYSFCTDTEYAGCPPQPDMVTSLLQASSGSFYGTTGESVCGPYEPHSLCGTVFKITSDGVFTTLHSFPEFQGETANPSSLIQAADTALYGTTSIGGGSSHCPGGCGTIFKMSVNGDFEVVHAFDGSDGCSPNSGLIQAFDGNFYGTTGCGANSAGTVFRLSGDGKTLTTIYTFCSQPNCRDGGDPNALIQGSDGNLYGTTGGGYGAYGTLYRLTPDGNFTTLHTFQYIDGFNPWSVLQGTNGRFYGTTTSGGAYRAGTVFSLDVGLFPFVALERHFGRVGQTGGIFGQGFSGTTGVELNGRPANFTVVSDTYIRATVPAGATSGYVTVTTPSGTLRSNGPFQVIR